MPHVTINETKEIDIYSPQFYGTDNNVYSVLLGNDSLACYNCIDQQFYNRTYKYIAQSEQC